MHQIKNNVFEKEIVPCTEQQLNDQWFLLEVLVSTILTFVRVSYRHSDLHSEHINKVKRVS